MGKEILARMLKEKAIKTGEFTLASGRKSNYYVNLKLAYTNPEILKEISRELSKVLEGEDYDLLAGVAMGGVPLAAATSIMTGKPYLIVRKEKKGYGTDVSIEGEYEKGERVIVLEDVTTTGGSVIKAVESLRGQGLECRKVITVVNRNEGACKNLKEHDIELIPIINIKEIL